MTPKKKNHVAVNAPPSPRGQTPADTNESAANPAELQFRTWARAVQLFSERRYPEAAALFREAARGPAVHVADKARSYEQICERFRPEAQVEFRTAEEHFYYGVERLNARDLPQARTHLTQALRLQPEGDHIFYTLSLCCGFSGDGNGAYENLKRAIDLDPNNRVMARQDSEFAALAQQFPSLRALLGPETADPN
jgi:tetratricopeptide (TPR) repeat protein